MIQFPLTHRRSWFLVTGFVAFLMVAGFSLYLKQKQASLASQIADLQRQKEELTAPKEMADGPNIPQELAHALAVKKQLQEIETTTPSWSKIYEKIQALVPQRKDTKQPIVDIRSSNGGEDGRVTLSATSQPNATDAWADLADTLHAFTTEPSFREAFIPSITKSVTPKGENVLTFSLNFHYSNK